METKRHDPRVQWRGAEVGGDENRIDPKTCKKHFQVGGNLASMYYVLAGLTFFVVEN